jgi:hypothetical protein
MSLRNTTISILAAAAILPMVAAKPPARPVVTKAAAVSRVEGWLGRNPVTSVPVKCLAFEVQAHPPRTFVVTVREHHSPECGGDPETEPRVGTFEVDKSSGRVTPVDDRR